MRNKAGKVSLQGNEDLKTALQTLNFILKAMRSTKRFSAGKSQGPVGFWKNHSG